jgi:hypothetical protein
MKIPILALAILAFVGRIAITPRLTHIPTVTGTYEALAHMLVGFLILVPFYLRHTASETRAADARLYGWLGWSLALWELGWFVAQRFL